MKLACNIVSNFGNPFPTSETLKSLKPAPKPDSLTPYSPKPLNLKPWGAQIVAECFVCPVEVFLLNPNTHAGQGTIISSERMKSFQQGWSLGFKGSRFRM